MSSLTTTLGMAGLSEFAKPGEKMFKGAGATFPAPFYKSLLAEYLRTTSMRVDYDAIGSGAGLRHIDESVVDFGATEKPMSRDHLESKGHVQFPVVIGGIVPVFNLKGPGLADITISGEVLAEIFLGNISKWNHPALRSLNPSRDLPDETIIPITRLDGSGTTFLYSNFLCKAHDHWRSRVGEGTSIKWPVGAGAKGSEGVVAYISRLPGSIGFVEYSHARQAQLGCMHMLNMAGQVVIPGDKSFRAAASQSDWSQSLGPDMNNSPLFHAWPVVGASFMVMQKKNFKSSRGAAVRDFAAWMLKNGDAKAEELGYVPLPDLAKSAIANYWNEFV